MDDDTPQPTPSALWDENLDQLGDVKIIFFLSVTFGLGECFGVGRGCDCSLFIY